MVSKETRTNSTKMVNIFSGQLEVSRGGGPSEVGHSATADFDKSTELIENK